MFEIDINSMVADLQLTKADLDQVRQLTVKAYVNEVYSETVNLAITKLASARGEYVGALKINKINNYTYELALEGSKLANMIESGAGSWDMKCILKRRTRIYTSKGYKEISKIKKGDLVLTRNGKFKRVSKIFKEENKDPYFYKIKLITKNGTDSDRNELCVTKHHPILTKNGWKTAEQLDVLKDELIVSARRCLSCNKLVPTYDLDQEKICCNRSCVGRNSMKGGELKDWLQKNAKGNHDWGMGALSPEKRSEMYVISGLNPSPLENRLWELIKDIKGIERQFPFDRKIKWKKANRNKFYYFDFAIPEHKICIEVNGERWHTEKQIEAKRKEVEKLGWRFISFWGKEVHHDIGKCVEEIHRILDNHEDKYEFTKTKFKIEKIYLKDSKKFCTTYNYKYNLTVEDDSSYIANGIVTHNSGFASSAKRVITKDGKGWYLTIPMLFKTTSANPRSDTPGQILPRAIYDLIRNSPTTTKDLGDEVVSTLAGKDIPNRYQPGQLTSLNKTADSYIAKNSIYAGLTRTKDKATGQSNYVAFRRVSDKSDPKSWIHPGIPAYGLMDKAMENVDHLDIAETALQKFFPKSTINIRVYGQQALEMNARYNQMLENMTSDIIDQIKSII
jgi:very-short-patch-repair endonuclease